jgi:hypothetical protein
MDRKPPEESTHFIPGSPLTQHCALRAVALCLLFAALTTTSRATQAQSNAEILLEHARSEEKAENDADAERIYGQALALAPDGLEAMLSSSERSRKSKG